MAVGNTFGATALSSYGGFWISVAIIFTPGGFDIVPNYSGTGTNTNDFNNAVGYFFMGWFIFTTVLLICTLRSTVMFFLLFFTLDLAFLFLGISHLIASDAGVADWPTQKAGGYFGLFAAFLAWYNALAGIADDRYVFAALTPFFGIIRFSLFPAYYICNSSFSCTNYLPSIANVYLLQQLLFRHPSLPLPLVRQGPRGKSCLQDRARDRLDFLRLSLVFIFGMVFARIPTIYQDRNCEWTI
jgi:succinate-acetate transporter protein